MDDTGETRRVSDREDALFSFMNVEKKDGVVLPRLVSHIDKVCSDRKSNGRKKLKHFFSAVLIGTSLAKKFDKRKYLQMLNQSNEPENVSAKLVNPADSGKQKPREQHPAANQTSQVESKANYVPNPSTCSCPSKPNLNESKPKQEDTTKGKKVCYNPKIGVYFIVVSLAVLVFWGKAYAIVCASTWLFFVPHWRSCMNSFEKGVVDLDEIDSEEYKKKIIMEGLLERNRNRGT